MREKFEQELYILVKKYFPGSNEKTVKLLIGLLIGPISNLLNLGIFGKSELNLFEYFLPFFAGLALVMILFEGGMKLSFFKTAESKYLSMVTSGGSAFQGLGRDALLKQINENFQQGKATKAIA